MSKSISKNAEKKSHLDCSYPQYITGITRVPRTTTSSPESGVQIIDHHLGEGVLDHAHKIVRKTLDVRGKSKIDQNGITSRIDELDRAKGFIKLFRFSIISFFLMIASQNLRNFPEI